MKRFNKILTFALIAVGMTSMFTLSASAATVKDGLSAELSAASGESNVQIDAVLKNANYFSIDGINCEVTASDNAVLKGDSKKLDFSLESGQSTALSLDVSLKTPPTSETTAETTAATTTAVTTAKPEGTTAATTTAAAIKLDTSSSQGKSVVNTGNDMQWLVPIALLAVFSALFIYSIKRKDKRMMSILLCLALMGSVTSFALGSVKVNAAENEVMKLTDTLDVTISGETVTLTFTVEYPKLAAIHDNSLADIQKLNNNNATVTYHDDTGEISFINGKFTDYKVINQETAMSSISAVESLLNIKDNDITGTLVSIKEDSSNGDTYYTFKQSVGAVLLSSSLITIGADKDGNTLCLSSSIDPKAGTVDFDTDKITQQQAEEKALADIPDSVLSDKATELDIIVAQGQAILCYDVYLKAKNPGSTLTKDNFSAPYYKVAISAKDGTPYQEIPMYTLPNNSSSSEDANAYFKVSTEKMTFTDAFGKSEELSVAKASDGRYYFCDTERKIIGFGSYDVDESGQHVPTSPYYFDKPENVSPNFVSSISNVIKTYDYYASHGIKSIDGLGAPIKICLGYKIFGTETNNAACAGMVNGFALFTFSDLKISTALDIVAHEFTHGIKGTQTGGTIYKNTTGAIEESYADILGNLTEMIVDPENSDLETWKIAEQTGTPIRCMANPNLYSQPEKVGSAFFGYDTDVIDLNITDNGFVHTNNSIPSLIAFKLHKNGLSLTDSYKLWLSTFFEFNPKADYDDIREYLKFSASREGLTSYIPTIQSLFEEANAVNADTTKWKDYPHGSDESTITINISNIPDGMMWNIVCTYNPTTSIYNGITVFNLCGNGTVKQLLKNGTIKLFLTTKTSANVQSKSYDLGIMELNGDKTYNKDYNQLISAA